MSEAKVVKKKVPGKSKRLVTKPVKIEPARTLGPIRRDNPIPKLSDDVHKLLVGYGQAPGEKDLRSLAVDIARLVNFAMPNGVMYSASVILAEFVSTMAYAPEGKDPRVQVRLRKAAEDMGFDWGKLCNKADTLLTIAAEDRLRELDQMIFEGNNDLIALQEMQRKYAQTGAANVTGGNAIKTCLRKMDAERHQLIERFPELVDDEAPQRHEETDEE